MRQETIIGSFLFILAGAVLAGGFEITGFLTLSVSLYLIYYGLFTPKNKYKK
jgi:hypothetical protein